MPPKANKRKRASSPHAAITKKARQASALHASSTPDESANSSQQQTILNLQLVKSAFPEADTNISPEPKTKPSKPPERNLKGYTPGKTPFPEHEGPTAAACEQVYQILAEHHKAKKDWFIQSAEIPRASLEMAGCGEVKKVHDALCRTVLSGATTMENANNSLQGLIKAFGVVHQGTEEESVDWDKIRLATPEEVQAAIFTGGLAIKKTDYLQKMLTKIHEQSLAQLKLENDFMDATGPAPTITTDILSLQHLRTVDKEEAIIELIQFDGIGVKTAACVALFCLRKDTFAVDVHVHRLCKWLGWVPQGCKEEIKTFNHCEIHVPDQLKYGLHQLFIMHGKECYRCRAATKEGTREWDACKCPIEHLVNRGEGKKRKQKKTKPIDPKQATLSFTSTKKTQVSSLKTQMTEGKTESEAKEISGVAMEASAMEVDAVETQTVATPTRKKAATKATTKTTKTTATKKRVIKKGVDMTASMTWGSEDEAEAMNLVEVTFAEKSTAEAKAAEEQVDEKNVSNEESHVAESDTYYY